MIPADVASRIRLVNDLVTQPVTPTPKLADVLSEFVPGQRLAATIQALMPNGTYRAMVAQRDVTLALPFAAKAGDALELEVVDTNGKLALAVATNKQQGAAADNASVATRLTVTGRLISELLAGMDTEGGKRPQPAPLNNAQPVVNRFPQNAADLVPALKAALVKSGMFYEAHQAQWVQGKTLLENLLQEPQGRLSPAGHALTSPSPPLPQSQTPARLSGQPALAASPLAGGGGASAAAAAATIAAGQAGAAQGAAAQSLSVAQNVQAGPGAPAAAGAASPTATPADSGAMRVGMNQMIAAELTTLVQQQLEALATNTYVWQGQIWPGQNMDWEILEEDGGREKEENTAANWTTRLRLTLPTLGGIAATLRLSGGKEIEITLRTESDAARMRLNAANAPLQRQFETAGLKLKSLAISRHAEPDAKPEA
ncbi:MAG: flagellar hook-length control protein FliK [Zoogloeaceae bacterium]|jgi:hypothetical protein|nr:flagellar hook-length control protein FliK [Zoogloeaceae bacterium]